MSRDIPYFEQLRLRSGIGSADHTQDPFLDPFGIRIIAIYLLGLIPRLRADAAGRRGAVKYILSKVLPGLQVVDPHCDIPSVAASRAVAVDTFQV